MTLYRNILSQALKTTWKHKYLWFFGLFAALLGNGGELEFIFRRFDGTIEQGLFPGLERILTTGVFSKAAMMNIGTLASKDPLSFFLVLSVLFVILVLVGFLIWLTITSQAALVNNTALARIGKKHDIKKGLSKGIKNFIPVFGLNLFIKALIYFAFIILSLPILISAGKNFLAASTFMFVLSFIVFIPVAIVLSFIIKYAIAFTVIKGTGFFESIKLGWQLFLKNWLISLEMAFILFFINVLVGIALVLVLLVFAVPFIFLALLFTKLGFYFNFWTIIVLAIIIYILAIVIVGAMLATFQIASWTGLFLELISKGGVSKLTRVFNKE